MNALVKSVVTDEIPKSTLIFSSKDTTARTAAEIELRLGRACRIYLVSVGPD